MNPEKRYLGDGAFVVLDDWGRVVLTTEDGVRATNTVVLEPETLAALLAWVRQVQTKREESTT